MNDLDRIYIYGEFSKSPLFSVIERLYNDRHRGTTISSTVIVQAFDAAMNAKTEKQLQDILVESIGMLADSYDIVSKDLHETLKMQVKPVRMEK